MNQEQSQAMTRREFVAKASAAAALGLMANPSPAADQPTSKPAQPLLPAGTLGKTKFPVTLVSFGAIKLAGPQSTRVLKLAINRGINLVHTSMSYGGGASVKAVGALLKNKTYREKVMLCLKSYTENAKTAADIEAEVDQMLTGLHTDRAEALFSTLMNPEPKQLDAIRQAQDLLKKKGKIRYSGFVCHQDMNGVIEMVNKDAPDYFDAALLAMTLVPDKDEKDEKKAKFVANLAALKKNGVGVLSMKSGAQKAVQADKATFEPHVKHILAAGADSILTSFSSFEQVEMATSLALKSPASQPEQQAAAEFRRSRSEACLMCASCTKACPQGVRVNDLMRVRMYCREYGMVEHARSVFASLGSDLPSLIGQCGDCTICSAVCPAKLASAERVREVAGWFA